MLSLSSLKQMVRRGYITDAEIHGLSAIRRYNFLLFDFVLKRSLRIDNKALDPEAFHTRAFFEPFSVGSALYKVNDLRWL